MAPPLPRFTMRGTASEAQRKKPLRWVATTAEKSAKDIFPTSPTRWIPALLTRMSICPAWLSIARNAAATLSWTCHVGLDIGYAFAGSSGLSLSIAKTRAPSRNETSSDPVADAARAAGDRCDLSRQGCHWRACPRSIHEPAAADVDRCAGDVVGVIGREEQDGARELRGMRHVAQRDLRNCRRRGPRRPFRCASWPYRPRPGETAFTVIFSLAKERASPRVIETMPPLVAA